MVEARWVGQRKQKGRGKEVREEERREGEMQVL